MAFAKAAALDDLWSGDLKGVVVAGRAVLLFRKDDQVFAYEDRCAHLGVPLSRGRLDGDVLTCSAHEWQYDATSGCGLNPTSARLRSFRVRIEGGEVWVDVDRPERKD